MRISVSTNRAAAKRKAERFFRFPFFPALLFAFLLPAAFPPRLSGQMREVSFYIVPPAAHRPEIDGKSDPVWKAIPLFNRYYRDGIPSAEPSLLKTGFRMCRDEKGIYLLVENYDDTAAGLRAECRRNGEVNIWRDDCAELYFDPECNGIGFTKFTVNSLGFHHDMRRLDTNVSLGNWSGSSLLLKTSVEKDRWLIEAFFPWSDLGKKAVPGDLWHFLHRRFSWKERFAGATSSRGADYRSFEKSGILYFSDGKSELSPETAKKILAGKIEAPWCLRLGADLLLCTGEKVELRKYAEMTGSLEHSIRKMLRETAALRPEGAALEKLGDLEKRFLAVRDDNRSADACCALFGIEEELSELKWLIRFEQNFN